MTIITTNCLNYITYKDSVEAENEQNFIVSESLKQTKFDKSLKSVLGFSFTSKETFEIPRQKSDKTVVPEVMNFKASQKLLDPKKNSISPATVSSAPRNIHENILNESSSVKKVEHENA